MNDVNETANMASRGQANDYRVGFNMIKYFLVS